MVFVGPTGSLYKKLTENGKELVIPIRTPGE